MGQYKTIKADAKDGVGIIQLWRPEKRNALSTLLFEEMTHCLRAWRQDDRVVAVVIHGTEEFFSAGLDLEILDRPSEAARLAWYDATYYGYLELLECPKPTIAAVAGPTYGGGCDIAVFCDMRIAAEGASFGFPQVRFGLTPFFDPLWRVVGLSQAKLLVLTGRKIDTQEAARINLVDLVVPKAKLLDAALDLAKEIAATGVATAVRATEMIRRTPSMDPQSAYVYAHAQYRDVHWGKDVNDRIAAARSSVSARKKSA